MKIKNNTVKDWLINNFSQGKITISDIVSELDLQSKHIGDLTEEGVELYEIIEDEFINTFLEKEEAVIYRPYNHTFNEFLIEMIAKYGEKTDLTDIFKLDKQGIEKIVNKIKSDYRIDILLEVLREKGVI